MADLSGRLRLPRVGLGAARPPQTLGDPGAVKPDTCPCTRTHTHTQPRQFRVLTGGTEALGKAVGGVLALTRKQWLPLEVPQRATGPDTWAAVHSPRHDARVGLSPDPGPALRVLRLVRLARGHHTRRGPWVCGGGGGVGTRPRYLIVCLWRRLLASRHCSF